MPGRIDEKQAYAYAELLEILSHINKKYIDKIPKKLMESFEKNKDANYVKHIDFEKPAEEQNISEKTLALIAMLMLNYWCDSEEQKQALKNIFDENEKKYQENLKKMYNPNKIFDEDDNTKKSLQNSAKISNQNLKYEEKSLIIERKIVWHKKIFIKIKSFFNKFLKNKKTST